MLRGLAHTPSLRGARVVVTGASAGVGRATVRAFAQRGASVGLIARGRDGLEGAAREVTRAGGKAVVAPADVSDYGQLREAAELIHRELGGVDIWVNNAMVTVFGRVEEITPKEFQRVTHVTYLGTVYGTMIALNYMRPNNRGTIVQVGSALAYRGIPLQSAYCGAKHAIQGFTESVRTELMHDGSDITLTMVQLPALNTPQFDWQRNKLPHRAQPVPPIFQPEVAAEGVVWAATHRRRELFVGAPTLKAIWGNKVAPWLGDWVLARTGFESQQTAEPAIPHRRDNLFEPCHGDHGAHGRFDDRAKRRSYQLWATTHRGALVAAGALGLLSLTLGMMRS